MSVDAGSTTTFPLLCHPAVESTSFVNFSPGLLKAHSGEIQMLLFFLFVCFAVFLLF